MIFGDESHRNFQRMSVKKIEVGDVFSPSVKERKCVVLFGVSTDFCSLSV